MDDKYLQVKRSLEELGYKYRFSNESLPLVEKLLSDLVQTTNSLRKYMKLAKEAVEERDSLLLGAEPYRCDNAKLVKECNDLHASLIRLREQSEKTQYELQKKLSTLQKEKQSCDNEHRKNIKLIKELELQHARKDHKSIKIQERIGKTVPCRCQSSTSALHVNKGTSSKVLSIRSAMVLADEKIAHLSKEVSRLKDERLELAEVNEHLKNKINTREKEIERLMELLQGGRHRSAVNEDCCYKNLEPRLAILREEIDYLKKCKRDSEDKFNGALAKQHEAMQRAMHLADRNKQLEKELRDIDQIALTVEADCNSAVLSNSEKINRLQERVHHCVMQTQHLERENMELKRDKTQYQGDLEAFRHEKQQLQNMLETVLDEKRRVTERLNQANIIENDLNIEIDRLTLLCAQQRRSLAEKAFLYIMSDREEDATDAAKVEESDLSDHKQKLVSQKKKKGKKLRKPQSRSASPKLRKHIISPATQKPVIYDVQSKYLEPKRRILDVSKKQPSKAFPKVDSLQMRKPYGDVKVPQNTPENWRYGTEKSQIESHAYTDVDKDRDDYDMENMKDKDRPEKDCRFEKLETERDFYAKEYHNLMEQFKNIPSTIYTGTMRDNENVQIKDLEQKLQRIRFEKDTLINDKQMLISKLQSIQDSAEEMDGLSLKSIVKRLERERDLLKSELSQLQDDRNELRKQLSLTVDIHALDNKKLEKIVLATEEQLQKIEHEKQNLLKDSGAKYSNIRGLEDQCDALREQLKLTQTELTQQKAIYSQLKSLLEQTNRSLSDCQCQLNLAENELTKSQSVIDAKDNEQKALKEEINNLKRDIMSLKGNVNHIDQEKDTLLNNLDDKTEQISVLQNDLKQKQTKISSLENNLTELQKQLTLMKDGSLTRDYKLKTSTSEITNLKDELEAALRAKDLALQENRRLQEDLATCAADVRFSRSELDRASRQVDDLKRQLQHYVAEVKRAEDLISQKEVERSEMLDQFRNLSEEATHLETNNHTLESEVSQNRVQLSVTLDHATELERKLEEQATLVRGYERQMAELTGQVANLEVQLRQRSDGTGRTNTELASLRDLCVKLDGQKDSMLKQLDEHSESKYQYEREIDMLKRDMEKMRTSLANEQTNVDNLEKLLAESRQDTVEQRLLSQELQGEVQRLKTKAQELQSKLSVCEQQLVEKSGSNIKDAKIENKPNAGRSSFLEIYTSKNSKSLISEPNNQTNELQKDVPVEIKETRHRPVEKATQQGRLLKEIEFGVPIAGNKVNQSKEISVLDADRYIPRYETIMSPVNDPRYFHHQSFDPTETLSKKKTSKVQDPDPKDDYNLNMRTEVTNGTNILPASPQIRSISESWVLDGENQNSKNPWLDLPEGVVPINGKFHHWGLNHINNNNTSNIIPGRKFNVPPHSNSKESNENSNIEIKSANTNIEYYNPTILDFNEASKITLNSKTPLANALNSKNSINYGERETNHYELQIPRTQDALRSNLNEENVSKILTRYGISHYTDHLAPNFDDASKVALYNKSHIHFDDIGENEATQNVNRSRAQNGDEANMKISKNGKLSNKLNNNTTVQQRQISKDPMQFSGILNNNNYDKKMKITENGAATENHLKISENNDKPSRKFTKDSYQLSNNFTINSINKQSEISKDTHQSSNKLNDHINDQVGKPSNKSGNNVTQNLSKGSRKFSKDSQHNKNNNSEIKKSSDVSNQSSNALNDYFVNRNVRKYSQEPQQLSNRLNKNLRKSGQTSGESIQESRKTSTLSCPDKRLSGLTNDNIDQLTRQYVSTRNTSSLQPIHDLNSPKETQYRRSENVDQTHGNNSSTLGTANNRKHDRQLISQINNNEQSFQPQWNQIPRSNSTQANNKSNLQKESESDKSVDAIRYRTDYSKYIGYDLRNEDGSVISSTMSPSSGNPTDKNKDSFNESNYDIEEVKTRLIANECYERDHSTHDSQEKHDHFMSPDASVQVAYNPNLRPKIQRYRNLKDENIKEYCDCPEHINVDVHFDIRNATCRHRNKRFVPDDCVCITQGMNTDVNDIKKTICYKNDDIVRDFLKMRSSTGEVSTNIHDVYSVESI